MLLNWRFREDKGGMSREKLDRPFRRVDDNIGMLTMSSHTVSTSTSRLIICCILAMLCVLFRCEAAEFYNVICAASDRDHSIPQQGFKVERPVLLEQCFGSESIMLTFAVLKRA